MKPPTLYPLRKNEVIQIAPSVRAFGGCLAIVHEMKSFGCVALVPIAGGDEPGSHGHAPIRLKWEEFERLNPQAQGADAHFDIVVWP